jgi:hypothetical protein
MLTFIRAFLSTDGIKCKVLIFRGKNRVSSYLNLWFFEGNLRKYHGFLCNNIYSQAALTFLADSSMAGLGSQKGLRLDSTAITLADNSVILTSPASIC